MGLVDYMSRNPYQPAKNISNFDEEFLVKTLSRIQAHATLLQQENTFRMLILINFT